MFPYICYQLWKDRNKCVFRNATPVSPQIILFKATKDAFDYMKVQPNRSNNMPFCINNSRVPVAQSMFVINVDASVYKFDRVCGVGGNCAQQ